MNIINQHPPLHDAMAKNDKVMTLFEQQGWGGTHSHVGRYTNFNWETFKIWSHKET